jgi:hypothetical protein
LLAPAAPSPYTAAAGVTDAGIKGARREPADLHGISGPTNFAPLPAVGPEGRALAKAQR